MTYDTLSITGFDKNQQIFGLTVSDLFAILLPT